LWELANSTHSNTLKKTDFTHKYRRLAEEFETTKRGMKDEINSDDLNEEVKTQNAGKRRGEDTKGKSEYVNPTAKRKCHRWPLYGSGHLHKLAMWQAKPRQEVCDAIDSNKHLESEVGCTVLLNTTICSLTKTQCDTNVTLFAQRYALYADCDLTNACAVISFEVAQHFLGRKTFPSDTVLAELIEKSASKTRYIRMQLKMEPDNYEEIDLNDMLRKIEDLYNDNTQRETLVNVFPVLNEINQDPLNFLAWATYYGVFTDESFFTLLQKRVETTIKEKGICALSFFLRSHYITGYFDKEVIFPLSLYNLSSST
jgi:hypothetical protein